MKIDELQNFTIDELSNLSVAELELEAKDLIKKLQNDNRELPFSVIAKLQELCSQMPEGAPKVKEGMTKAEICMLLTFMITYMTNLPEISKKWAPIFQAIIDFLINQFN
ncbi:hypothetical protein [uncultured Ruminococcus sp.]|uniref:hypothetical protein n=1 Tax=uncultured Ruminococcus sp. TaxID=165186 RepID=UPI0025DFA59D|nr:hypothetical protein [uncultured Ruminococcus sp.]